MIVLGVSLIVAAMAYGGLAVTRTRNRIATEVADAAEARRYAQHAIDVAQLWIKNDPNWRSAIPVNGQWASNVTFGSGTFSIHVSDPADNNVADFPHDSAVVKATGAKGSARHILEVTILAKPVPLPALRYSLHTAGQLRVISGATLNAAATTVSTNSELSNSGTINGNVECSLVNLLAFGTVNGSTALLSPAKDVPAVNIADKYAAVGRLINPGILDKHVLGPGINTAGGGTDPNGIYVIRPAGDFTIKFSRVYGTLVLIMPAGKKVIIEGQVLLHPFRNDAASLIVSGNADIIFQSGTTALREADHHISFNPEGAPYNGFFNSSKNESFPSEIQGLVHVTGKVLLKSTARINGALMCNSSASSEAVRIENTPSLAYPSSIFTSPPMWYTTTVPMSVQRGSWKQVAN